LFATTDSELALITFGKGRIAFKIGGLGPNGKLLLIGVSSDPIEFAPVQLIRGGKTIEGWAGVTPADSDDALRFAELRGVRAMIETYPLEKAAEAYALTRLL
jgi:D-arabinose 1-dehydrogenase-like Zn-dependent alcohol dehydrogenase